MRKVRICSHEQSLVNYDFHCGVYIFTNLEVTQYSFVDIPYVIIKPMKYVESAVKQTFLTPLNKVWFALYQSSRN